MAFKQILMVLLLLQSTICCASAETINSQPSHETDVTNGLENGIPLPRRPGAKLCWNHLDLIPHVAAPFVCEPEKSDESLVFCGPEPDLRPWMAKLQRRIFLRWAGLYYSLEDLPKANGPILYFKIIDLLPSPEGMGFRLSTKFPSC